MATPPLPPPGEYLKRHTRAAHVATEALLLGGAVKSHSVTLHQYRSLIRVTHFVWRAAQRAIPTKPGLAAFAGRARLLTTAVTKDVEYLGLKVDEPPPAEFPKLTDATDALAAYYVLIGSTLGGRVLVRLLRECPELTHLEHLHFYEGCAAVDRALWPDLQSALNTTLVDRRKLERCARKANAIFDLYRDWYTR